MSAVWLTIDKAAKGDGFVVRTRHDLPPPRYAKGDVRPLYGPVELADEVAGLGLDALLARWKADGQLPTAPPKPPLQAREEALAPIEEMMKPVPSAVAAIRAMLAAHDAGEESV